MTVQELITALQKFPPHALVTVLHPSGRYEVPATTVRETEVLPAAGTLWRVSYVRVE